MRSWRKLVILVLLLAFTPGAAEAALDGLHWLAHGHGPHSRAARGDDVAAGREHGCSGSFHLCSCHWSPTFVVAGGGAIRQPLAPLSLTVRPTSASPRAGFHSVPEHPPRS